MRNAANALLAAVILVTPLSAQRGHASGGSMPRSVTSIGGHANHSVFPRAVYLGSPFWTDDFSSPYAQSPSVIVLQTPQPAAAASSSPKEEPKPASPLMIEWQGDRYVRRTDTGGTTTRNNQPDYIAEAKPHLTEKHSNTPAAQPATTARSTEFSPAMFVFRDGHREQSSDYSIISGVIYARGDYWTNGYWSKQIPVSQLDLPATFKANQERGVAFRLPAAPNEVITRP
jgi:hypothetical protein